MSLPSPPGQRLSGALWRCWMACRIKTFTALYSPCLAGPAVAYHELRQRRPLVRAIVAVGPAEWDDRGTLDMIRDARIAWIRALRRRCRVRSTVPSPRTRAVSLRFCPLNAPGTCGDVEPGPAVVVGLAEHGSVVVQLVARCRQVGRAGIMRRGFDHAD